MITLIIVDCQNDFISGSLSVKGAKKALDGIKSYIQKERKQIEKIIFTVDWHPYDHCSFKKNGGEWPLHCVQYTPGACIEPKLLKFVQSQNIPYEVSQKGDDKYREQYGAFEEIEFVQDTDLISHYYFDSIVTVDAGTNFVVCGIAGDYCVKETMKNLIGHWKKFNISVLMDGTASIDGGTALNDFINSHDNIKAI